MFFSFCFHSYIRTRKKIITKIFICSSTVQPGLIFTPEKKAGVEKNFFSC